jgi:RHS repeat-associated protein
VTDARGLFAQFSYNNRNLLTVVDYSDSTLDVSYGYGEYGERTLMEEKSGGTTVASTSYGYDTYKRLQTETRAFQGLAGSYSVSYAYNLVDALKQVTYNVGAWSKSVNYDYNYAGAPSKVGSNLNPSGVTTENVMKDLSYRAFGALKSANFGNTRRIEAGYSHHRNNLTSLQVKLQNGTDTIINQGYDYYLSSGTNNGRVQKVTDYVDSNYTTTYEYDDFNRLEKAYGPAFYRDFDYDAWGNLTNVYATGGGETGSYSLSYATNGTGAPLNNRINNAGYSYDLSGNQTNDGFANYTYDAASRLKTVGTNNSCDYDGDGRKVKQVSGGYPLYYLWSSVLGEPVAELTSGGVYRAYVYGPGGQLLALQSADANFYWAHTDRLGSGRKLTNASGAVVYRAEFDPHGQQLYEWASGGATFLNSHKFTGYERDWATNLDYAKARTYTRYRGRFLQPDPMGIAAADVTNPQSLNRYGYVGNDPANFVDPSGLNSEAPPIIRIETWEPGPWWNYFVWMLLFGWGGGGGGYQPVGGGGGGLDFSGGDGTEDPQSPSPTPQQAPIHCQPDVIKAMKTAWSQSGNGSSGVEAGFNLNGTPNNYKVAANSYTNQQKKQSVTINTSGPNKTFAIFHVHPNGSGGNPSTPDNNSEGNKLGDTGIADKYNLQIYVMREHYPFLTPLALKIKDLGAHD